MLIADILRLTFSYSFCDGFLLLLLHIESSQYSIECFSNSQFIAYYPCTPSMYVSYNLGVIIFNSILIIFHTALCFLASNYFQFHLIYCSKIQFLNDIILSSYHSHHHHLKNHQIFRFILNIKLLHLPEFHFCFLLIQIIFQEQDKINISLSNSTPN